MDANVIEVSPRPHPMNLFFRRPQVSLVPTRKVIPPLILISVRAIKNCELGTRMSTTAKFEQIKLHLPGNFGHGKAQVNYFVFKRDISITQCFNYS